ncbi:hypothetical protein GCM10023311_07000 [Flaviramulus aquimarinus]|uniref:Uncharacterized protein n=1 Tax=Flaviramulus aquimarinus TaxID=1170456 RepID=A0ABP9EVE6_9FLAO
MHEALNWIATVLLLFLDLQQQKDHVAVYIFFALKTLLILFGFLKACNPYLFYKEIVKLFQRKEIIIKISVDINYLNIF